MSSQQRDTGIDRRDFMKTSAAATVAGAAALSGKSAQAADDGLIRRNERPDKMKYRRLGKTNFNCSVLTFGCGAALMGGKATRLLSTAFEEGVNHFDVGTNTYYRGSEKELAAFIKGRRDDVWITSKAFARSGMGTDPTVKYTPELAAQDAAYWTKLLEDSLTDLQQDHVDAYYIMAVGDPDCVRSEEMYNAFVKAKEAGKVSHFGISTHKRAEECLQAAIDVGWYSQAMIAITPAGWYDWDLKSPLPGTKTFKELQPLIKKAREADIGLVGMKHGRFLAPGVALGKGDETAFDNHYNEAQLASGLDGFQRSYAFCLEHGLDTVNADMQNMTHFQSNLVAVRESHKYFA